MNDIQVSICIPTYNRYEYLKKTLLSIEKDEAFSNGKIEVVISDNNSVDDTELLCREYANKYANIRYYKNKENIGWYNTFKVIKYAEGNLIKLWNDTMLMKKGAGNRLCEIERKYRNTMPVIFFENRKSGFLKKEDSGVISFDELIKKASYRITWNGSFSVWAARLDDLDEKGSDLCLWQVEQFCKLGCKNGGVYVKFPFAEGVAVKGKDISYGVYQVFYLNFMKKIINSYKQRGYLKQNTWDFLRRDLLFNFFSSSMRQWEMWKNGDRSLLFSESENLPQLVHDEYCNEKYYKKFLLWYDTRKTKEKGGIKYLLSKIKYIINIS